MITVEELQGVVTGLASVVKQLTTNVSQVSQTVGQLAEANPTQHHTNLQGLRMPALQIPSFRRDNVVGDDISEYLERFTVQTATLPAATRRSLLEQQCVGTWLSSILSIAQSTEGYGEKSAEEKLKVRTNMLRAEFAESKEDKCRRLASELSAINQDPAESVEEFAFRYKKLLHQLEKLGEKIGKDCPTFPISKVKPAIYQQIIVKAAHSPHWKSC